MAETDNKEQIGANQEDSEQTTSTSPTPTADFMLDFREGVMSTPTYFNWLGRFTDKKPITFGRLSIAFGAVLVSVVVMSFFFGSDSSKFPDKGVFILPSLILVIASLWSAYLIIRPQKTQTSFSVGWAYFRSKFRKGTRNSGRFDIVDIRNGVVLYGDKTIGLCYEIGGSFSETMFDSNIDYFRSRIHLNRNRLSENITTIPIVEIGNTNFASQKQYLKELLDNAENPYQKQLLQQTNNYFSNNLKTEQVLKSYYEFRVHNNEEKRQVEELLRNYLSDGILTFYRFMSKEELIKMKEDF